ncbi:MAG: thioredoxin family protein [Candidatus Aenigmarchaeota archaeon]|nr:thioredoxin family protein [Candidatus Aenigmarchaeota archaeon]
MKLLVFTKKDCPNCPPAKKLAKDLEKDFLVVIYDISEVDSLAEAQFYGVMSTPSLILVDEYDKEIRSWRGTTPSKEEILKYKS